MAVHVDYMVVKSGTTDTYRIAIKPHWRSLPNDEGFTLFKQKVLEVCGFYPNVVKDSDGAVITSLDTISTAEVLQVEEAPPDYAASGEHFQSRQSDRQVEVLKRVCNVLELDQKFPNSNKISEIEAKLSDLSSQVERLSFNTEEKNQMDHVCSTGGETATKTALSHVKTKCSKLEQSLEEMKRECEEITYKLSRVPVAPNLIKNSLMRNVESDGNPAGFQVCEWITGGRIECKAVHPFTQGFEGCFSQNRPPNSVKPSKSHLANEQNPVFFGSFYMGPRLSRGGLSTGWNSICDGKILRISGERVDQYETAINLPVVGAGSASMVRFTGWVKCVKGSVMFSAGLPNWDKPEPLISGDRKPGLCRVEDCAWSPQGWFHMDDVISISNITHLNGKYSFLLRCFGPLERKGLGEFEIYIALPSAALVECPQKVTVVPFVNEWKRGF